MCFQPFKDKQKLSGEKEKREVGKEIFIQLIVKEPNSIWNQPNCQTKCLAKVRYHAIE
jgi:hypothetical protein